MFKITGIIDGERVDFTLGFKSEGEAQQWIADTYNREDEMEWNRRVEAQ